MTSSNTTQKLKGKIKILVFVMSSQILLNLTQRISQVIILIEKKITSGRM